MNNIRKYYNNLSINELVSILLHKIKTDQDNHPIVASKHVIDCLRPCVTRSSKTCFDVSFFQEDSSENIICKVYSLKIENNETIKIFGDTEIDGQMFYREAWPPNYAEELAIFKESLIKEIELYET